MKGASKKTQEYIIQLENRTKNEIDERIKNQQSKNFLSTFRLSLIRLLYYSRRNQIKKSEKKLVNPLITTLYCKMAFLALKHFSMREKRGKTKKKSEMQDGISYFDSSKISKSSSRIRLKNLQIK